MWCILWNHAHWRIWNGKVRPGCQLYVVPSLVRSNLWRQDYLCCFQLVYSLTKANRRKIGIATVFKIIFILTYHDKIEKYASWNGFYMVVRLLCLFSTCVVTLATHLDNNRRPEIKRSLLTKNPILYTYFPRALFFFYCYYYFFLILVSSRIIWY